MRGFDKVEIGKLVRPIQNWNPSKVKDARAFWYIDISSVDRESKKITDPREVLTPEAPSRARQLVKENDVLVSTVRPNLNGVAIVPHELEGATASTGYCVLRARPERLDTRYLFYWVRSRQFVADMERKATGASYPAVTDAIIKTSLIPLPSLPVQRRIAAVLDKADALRRKRHHALDKLDDLLQAVFLDMFGDPVTNPKAWLVEELGDLSSIRRGASPRPISKYMGGTVPWIKIGDATKEGTVFLERTAEYVTEAGAEKSVYLDPGSLIVANSGVSLGFARILRIGGCIHDGWLSIEKLDERINKIYLLHLINSLTNHLRQTAPEGTQPNLNTTLMRGFKTPLPPITLQGKFENTVFRVLTLERQLNEHANKAEFFFNALIQKAFKGELTFAEEAIEETVPPLREAEPQMTLFD